MKKYIFAAVLLLGIIGTSNSVMGQNCPDPSAEPGTDQVMVYAEENYQGECHIFTGFRNSFPRYKSPIRSIKVGRGIEIFINDKANFRGNARGFRENIPSLSYPGGEKKNQWVSVNFGERPQEKRVAVTPRPSTTADLFSDDKVQLCQTTNLGGGCRFLGVGNYSFNTLKYKSIRVGKNVKAQVYTETNFYGRTNVYPSGSNQRTNEEVQSIRVMNPRDDLIAANVRPTPVRSPQSTAGPTPVKTPEPTVTPGPPVNEETPEVVPMVGVNIGGEGYRGPDSNYQFCARDGDPCKYSGQVRIAYGVGDQFSVKTFNSLAPTQIRCNESTFGDPAPRLPKRCYIWQLRKAAIIHAPPNSKFQECSRENERCNFNYIGTVAFGVNGVFNYKTNVTRGIDCNTNTFGDPAPGLPKKCYSMFVKEWKPNTAPTETDNPGPPNSNFRVCGVEGGICKFKGKGRVAYGYNEKNGRRFIFKNNVNGEIRCDDQTFGSNPAPGKRKACYVQVGF